MGRRVVKARDATIFGKYLKVESSVIGLEEGTPVRNPEDPGVEDLVKGQEVASHMKGSKVANPVKGPEVVVECHVLESFVKGLAVEILTRNPEVGSAGKGHQVSLVEDQEMTGKKRRGTKKGYKEK